MGWSCDTYYEVLGVARNASADQIKTARKKMALSLHPDKNEYGGTFMKAVNEAYETLSDERKRRTYDREMQSGGRARGRDSPSTDAENQNLKRQLREYKNRVQHLQSTIARNKSDHEKQQRTSRLQVKKLSDSLRAKEQECIKQERSLRAKGQECTRKERERLALQKRLDARVTYFEEENKDLQQSLNNVQTESDTLRDQLNNQVDMSSKEKVLARKALREERRRSADNLAKELKAADRRAETKVESVKREMSERSICYQCNGEGGETCICEGRGSLQGTWTKCLNCKGAGLFPAWGDELLACSSCLAKGAKEGCLTTTCFKCKGGAEKNCSVCYHGQIRGVGIMQCPFCTGDGDGCENCLERGHVSCHYVCGLSCRGHKVGDELPKPRGPSSLQRMVAATREGWRISDWEDAFMSARNHPLSATSEGGGAAFSYDDSYWALQP